MSSRKRNSAKQTKEDDGDDKDDNDNEHTKSSASGIIPFSAAYVLGGYVPWSRTWVSSEMWGTHTQKHNQSCKHSD